jgi:hypothetical protein
VGGGWCHCEPGDFQDGKSTYKAVAVVPASDYDRLEEALREGVAAIQGFALKLSKDLDWHKHNASREEYEALLLERWVNQVHELAKPLLVALPPAREEERA